jgi:O-antigen/teichoic acid export membrane protein
MLKYAWPLMFMGLAGMVNELLDRILLKEILPQNFYPGMSNDAAVGIYGACYKLSIFMSLAIQAFRYAAEPFFFSKSEDKNAPESFAKIMHWFIIVCCLILIGITLNLSWIQYLLTNPAYRVGLGVVPILLLANLFLGVYYNQSVWYKLTDKTYFGTIITLVGAAITLIGLWILIPIAGYMGAAWATFICYFSITMISYFLGQKYFPVPYNVGKAFIYISLSVSIILIFNYINPIGLLKNIVIGNCLIIGFIALVALIEKPWKKV